MKKFLALVLVLCLALPLAACSNSTGTASTTTTPSATPSTTTTTSVDSFVKPEAYASVLLVTINPQFALYLDENGTVLAVEAVNQDAASIKDSINFENQSVETVLENIVTAANQSGFVKADATIILEITESKETYDEYTEILREAEQTVNDTAEKLQLTVEVAVSERVPDTDLTATNAVSDPTVLTTTTTTTKTTTKTTTTTTTKATTTTTAPRLTSALAKQGYWKLQYVNNNTLYSVSINIGTPGKYSLGMGLGDPVSGLPPEMQNDPSLDEYCETFNGKKYYIGRGDGDELTSVTENGNTVTITDSSGETLVLTRTAENTLKCASAKASFSVLENLPAGCEFTFVADN